MPPIEVFGLNSQQFKQLQQVVRLVLQEERHLFLTAQSPLIPIIRYGKIVAGTEWKYDQEDPQFITLRPCFQDGSDIPNVDEEGKDDLLILTNEPHADTTRPNDIIESFLTSDNVIPWTTFDPPQLKNLEATAEGEDDVLVYGQVHRQSSQSETFRVTLEFESGADGKLPSVATPAGTTASWTYKVKTIGSGELLGTGIDVLKPRPTGKAEKGTAGTAFYDAAGDLQIWDPGEVYEHQDIWLVFKATGSGGGGETTADTKIDEFTFNGSGGVTCNIVGDILTIDAVLAGGAQDLWSKIISDSGQTIANVLLDELSILGGLGIRTSIAGDVLTIALDGNESYKLKVSSDDTTPDFLDNKMGHPNKFSDAAPGALANNQALFSYVNPNGGANEVLNVDFDMNRLSTATFFKELSEVMISNGVIGGVHELAQVGQLAGSGMVWEDIGLGVWALSSLGEVKVSADDTTADFLDSKIITPSDLGDATPTVPTNLALVSWVDPSGGANEKLNFDFDINRGSIADYGVDSTIMFAATDLQGAAHKAGKLSDLAGVGVNYHNLGAGKFQFNMDIFELASGTPNVSSDYFAFGDAVNTANEKVTLNGMMDAVLTTVTVITSMQLDGSNNLQIKTTDVDVYNPQTETAFTNVSGWATETCS